MILYTLKCGEGHRFEAWLPGSEAYEAQRAAGQIACAVCGSAEVAKDLMAPAVGARRAATREKPLSGPASPAETVLRELRRKIEREADYVGDRFAAEARAIHAGDAAERAIWGEASRAEAKELKEDGIPVAPLPRLRKADA